MQRGKGGGFGLEAAALALLAAGIVLAVTGWYSRYAPPPVPPASAAGMTPGGSAGLADGAAGSAAPPAEPRPLGFSPPVHVDIPAIGVHARVIPLGQNPDGSVQVPPLSTPFLTGWLDDAAGSRPARRCGAFRPCGFGLGRACRLL